MLKPRQLSEFVAGGARAIIIEALAVIAIAVIALGIAYVAIWLG